MKKLAIFDLDGTLLDTIDDLATAVNYALSVNSLPTHAIQSYRMMVGNGVRRLVERALPEEKRSQGVIDQLLVDFRQYYNGHLYDLSRPYDGIIQLLEELHDRGVALAVASNKYESAVKELIGHFFGNLPFVAVCGNIEGVPVKPDPSIVFRILSENPIPKADVIYIGDSAVDIETARRACVDSVAVTWGFRPLKELQEAVPDHIIDSPVELLDLIG